MRFSKSLLSRFTGVRFVSLSRSQRRKLRGSPVAAETLEIREMPTGVATLPQVDLVAIDASKTVNARAYFHVGQNSVRFGDTVTVNLAIANQGASASSASATFDIRFVLLPNGSAPLSVGVPVGTASGISIPRSGGTTFVNQFRITLPEVAPFAGSGFSLAAVIDPLNTVQESNEANNSRQGLKRDIVDLTISPMLPNKPDLIAVDASRSINSRAYFRIQQNSMRFGDTVKVDLAIANQGTSPASGASSNLFDVNFILLPNSSTPLNQGVLVGTATNLKVPNAGQSIFLDGFSLKLPEAAPFAGRGFTLMAVIDPQNKVAEFNESNNSLQGSRRDAVDITIDPSTKTTLDLVAASSGADQGRLVNSGVMEYAAQPGTTIHVTQAILNQGTATVAPGTTFDVSIVLISSIDADPGSGLVLGTATGLAVPQPGKTTLIQEFAVTIPQNVQSGNYAIATIVNPTSRLPEGNLRNNQRQGAGVDLFNFWIAKIPASQSSSPSLEVSSSANGLFGAEAVGVIKEVVGVLKEINSSLKHPVIHKPDGSKNSLPFEVAGSSLKLLSDILKQDISVEAVILDAAKLVQLAFPPAAPFIEIGKVIFQVGKVLSGIFIHHSKLAQTLMTGIQQNQAATATANKQEIALRARLFQAQAEQALALSYLMSISDSAANTTLPESKALASILKSANALSDRADSLWKSNDVMVKGVVPYYRSVRDQNIRNGAEKTIRLSDERNVTAAEKYAQRYQNVAIQAAIDAAELQTQYLLAAAAEMSDGSIDQFRASVLQSNT